MPVHTYMYIQANVRMAVTPRLPTPCPLPNNFDGQVKHAIKTNSIIGDVKLRLIRQAGKFYNQLCPQPTPSEYQQMAVTLCDNYRQLRDKNSSVYWVIKYTYAVLKVEYMYFYSVCNVVNS